MNKKLLVIIMMLFGIFSKVNAQGTAGKDFWVAFMAQDWGCYYNNNWYNQDTAQLFLSSQHYASITISAPGQNFVTTVNLVPNVTSQVMLPREVVCRYSDSVTTNGVHVVSDSTINVYAVNRYWYSKGATVVLPVTSIVQAPEYFITTSDDTYSWGWSCNGKLLQSPEFTIVGIADSSVIEIVPTGASSRNSPAGVPFQITLRRGETFQYMTTDRDLTGSIVRAKYPMSKFSVFAGNRQSWYTRNVANQGTCYSSWDHNYEQMLPSVTWGTDYTAMPFKNSGKGYILKVLAAENFTSISINGTYYGTLNQGKFFTIPVDYDTITRISSNNRISVAQFATGGYYCTGSSTTYNPLGDPAQVQLFPDVQMGTNATINTVSETNWWWWWNNWWNSYLPQHYVNVLSRSNDTGYFKLNHKSISNSLWKADPNLGGYHFAQLKIDSGSHYMSSNRGFLSYVYGYGRYEGYAFAAAANFKPIQNNFLIVNAQCKRDTVEFNAIETDSFSNYNWVFGDGNTGSGAKVKHKYADTGWYTVKMYCNHILTNALDSVTKTLYVADTKIRSLFNRDTLICGPVNMIVISKGFNIDNEYRWNDNHFVYYRAIKNPGTYWLEVKERNGCVYRDTLLVANGEIPEPNLSVNYDVFCLNRSKSVEFKNHSKSKDSIDYYRWDFGDTLIYTTDTNVVLTHQFKKADTYPVLLRAQTKKGCYYDTFVFIEVLPAPKANFTFTVKDTCFGTNQIVLKNNTVINKNDHRRFKWTFSEGYNLSNNNPPGPRSYLSTGNYKVYLIYENTNGCIDTMVQNVTIVSDPVADFSVPSSIYCTLDTMPFNGTISTSVNKPLKYDWLFDDNTTSTDSIAKKAFTITGNTSIRLAVESPKGCKDTMIKTILVNEKPKVDFVINKDTQCLYGHNFDFTNTTIFNAGSLNYTWNLSNNTNSADSNLLNVKFAQDSTYKVKLSTTTSVGCYAEKIKNVYLGAYPNAGFNISKDKQCFRGNAFDFNNQSTFKNASLKSTIWNFDNGDTSHKTSINAYKYLTEDTFDVKMIVVSSLGCMDTLTKRVIVFPQAKSLFTINNNVQCSKNQKFVFTNQSTVKSGNLNFKWDFGDNKTSTDTNYVKQYNVPAQYNVKLIVGTDNNCPDTSSQSVTVNVSPNSVFNISSDKQCFKGNSFSFTNSSNIPTGTINSTKWLMDDGNEYSTINVSNHIYTTEDTFNVKLISVSDRNCQDTMTKMAITFAQPVIDFDIPNDTQCWQKNKFVIVNKTKLKYGVLSSLWNFGDNTSSNNYNPTDKVYPNTSASYVISYKAISDHGCRDSATRNIALLERPVSDFSINDSIQCFKGHLFSFTNKTTFSVMSTLSYWWDYDNGDNSTGFAPKTAVYPVPDKYNVQLISFSSLTNCFDTTYKTVIPAPHANVKFTVDKDSQCFRSNRFHFLDASTLDFGNMNYKWDFGDNTSSSDTSPYKSYKQDGAYNIKLVLTTNYGCTDSVYSSVGFYPNPFAGFNINDTAQCLNAQSFDLTNTSTLKSGVMTYDWWMDDNSTFSSKDVIGKQFTIDDVHNIRLAVATDQGCTDTMRRTVYLERTGNSDILLLENDSQCYKGNRFDFNRNSNNNKVNFISYKWLYDDGQEANVSDPAAMSYKKDGDYNVQLITVSANACNDTITKRIIVHPHPITSFTAVDVCFPEPVKFTNTSSISKGSIGASYWNTGDGGKYKQFEPTHTYANAGTFNVELITESNYGCKDTLFKPNAVKVKAKPIANFEFSGLPITTPNQTRLQFKNLSSANANKFNWDFGNNTNSTDRDPIGEYGDTGTYWVALVAYSDEGCTDTFKLNTGKLIPDFAYFLPSAFSPNGDIHNQIYKGFATTYTFKFKMEIFNRWGEKLWETDDITQGWDGFYNGELCMEGAYLCRVQIVPFKGYMRTFEQMFMLMR